MLLMVLIQLVTMLFFILKAGQLMTSAARYLDAKGLLIAAQLEGKRFVDERVGQAKSVTDDDSKYRPKS